MFVIAKWRQIRYDYHRNYEGHDDEEKTRDCMKCIA